MRKHLKIFIISQLLLIHTSVVFASNQHPFYSQIISSEYNQVNGSFTYDIMYKFLDTTTFMQNTDFYLPSGWSASVSSSLYGNTYYPDDSVIVTITVNYPQINLPFFPEDVVIKQFYLNIDYFDPSKSYSPPNIEQSVSAKIYFTPYETIEIWSIHDFIELPRKWLNPELYSNPVRIPIVKNDIPVSDINLSSVIDWLELPNGLEDDWYDNYREIPRCRRACPTDRCRPRCRANLSRGV